MGGDPGARGEAPGAHLSVLRILLTPAGSAGDVNPFVGLGRTLRERGHEVVVLTAEPFREAVESAGLEFVPVLSRERYEGAIEDPDLWHPIRGLESLFRLLDREALEASWQALEDHHVPGRTVLVGHMLSFATRAFEEVRDVPAATVQLAPIAFRTRHLQPLLPPGVDPGLLPPALRRAFWWAADLFVTALPHRHLHPFLRSRGLQPPRRLFESWVHSPRRVLGFFPPWFAPVQPDWPPALRLVGFPLYDGFAGRGLDPALEAWLDEGPAPVVFTPGSANAQAPDLFRAATRATEAMGLRALFVTPWRRQLPDPLPPHTYHAAAAPFSRLLPRCRAAVHHGGVGTVAQALAAGLPQVVQGRAFDQPDNGARLERLGVGRRIGAIRLSERALRRALHELLADAGVATATARLAQRMAREAGAPALARAADEVEALSAHRSGRAP